MNSLPTEVTRLIRAAGRLYEATRPSEAEGRLSSTAKYWINNGGHYNLGVLCDASNILADFLNAVRALQEKKLR